MPTLAAEYCMAKTRATSRTETPPKSDAANFRRAILLGGGLIVLAVVAAYANTFSAPFVFDDPKAILENPTILHLGQLKEVLSAPSYVGGAAGRPIINLSLAINYAISGPDVTSYHLFNTLVHALAGLTLFGIVRRTLLQPALRDRFGAAALPLALGLALLWTLHPLQTESVTCIIQRTESLMGLFYLLTLYGFIRASESGASRGWSGFTIAVCLLGMATKEVMVSAPVMVLLYDRTFVAGSLRAAWRARWRLYLGLAATWLLLAYLVVGAKSRGGAVAFGGEVTPWTYALTQCRAIVIYLRLVFWPDPLILDYGTAVVTKFSQVWLQALIVVVSVVATLVALGRRPVLGFLGFWFFAILAPSSSVVPLVTQTIAEHRMYLPLAAVVAAVVLGGYVWVGRRTLPVWFALAALTAGLTVVRNADYRSDVTVWAANVADMPDNARAQTSLGCVLATAGRSEAAYTHLAEAVRLDPDLPDARFNLGNYLFRHDRAAEALEQCEAAVRLRPNYFEAYFLLGGVLLQLGRTAEAIEQIETALRIQPEYVEAHQVLADTLVTEGRTAEALEHYERAVRLRPGSFGLHVSMGNVLARMQRWPEAEAHFAAAVRLHPESPVAQSAWGEALGRSGRPAEAVEHFEAAARLDPNSVPVHYNLGNALFALRRFAGAAEHYEAVVRLQPDFAEAHNNLANTLVELGRLDDAEVQYGEALRLKPGYMPARNNLRRLQALKAGAAAR